MATMAMTDMFELNEQDINTVSGGNGLVVAGIVVAIAVATFPDFFKGLGDGLTDDYKGK